MIQLKYSYALKMLPLAMIAGLLPLFSRGLFWSEDWLGTADFSVVCVALMAPLCLLTGSLELIHHRKNGCQNLWPRQVWNRQVLAFGLINSLPYVLALTVLYLVVTVFAAVSHACFGLLNPWSFLSMVSVILMASYLGVFVGNIVLSYVFAPLLALLWFAAYNWLGFPYYFFLPGGATEPLTGYTYNLMFKSIQWLFALIVMVFSALGILFPRLWWAFVVGIGASSLIFSAWFTTTSLSPFVTMPQDSAVCATSGEVKVCVAPESKRYLSAVMREYDLAKGWFDEHEISLEVKRITTFGPDAPTCSPLLVVPQRGGTKHIEHTDIESAYIARLLDCKVIPELKYQQLQDDIWLGTVN